ncbi:D-amino acid oxidase [Ophidiomyces ophidiicola]|uniref:D-amino acid oxidase n=1 Tax=Ophidiomyces ophidiicola TaxID=1387563 RepID=A0ACB8UWI5_9EURO|nr:D-amino acid oxidase [Ophidiomyces ophidiicola]KAI1914423.1 D-amino acid oxidase [Ophidiomyces ophidiicola]KAI1931255.1 D-amino acid oxidase [Ophidiomyces ophidiicola]KAI1956752.1 D-amino acid oxidase [Ophidiomyces ophidiicola]KAI1974594.1 D-amino acid oxidase [Ophidiomyces ophidiicola]
MASHKVVVIGGGVIGLTTAYLLSKNKMNDITVAAKHMPGDYDVEYCSPWAGANFLPVGAPGSAHARWETNTWPVFEELARNNPEAGIHFQDSIIYNRLKDASSDTGVWFKELIKPEPWYKDIVPDFRSLPKEQLPHGYDNGSCFTSVCLNAPVYLAWLVSQCRKNGVVFKRAVFKHIVDAASAHHSGQRADVVVNCTGLASKYLGGVEDAKMYPARGQVIVVRNEAPAMVSVSGTDDGPDEAGYIMMRAAGRSYNRGTSLFMNQLLRAILNEAEELINFLDVGGGTILGGCYQRHCYESQPDPNLAVRIMKRAVAMCPDLVGKDASGNQRGIEAIDIIRHGVGLRPLREGGTRVERDTINGVSVVHNYGHGGFGYQASFGCCAEAAALVTKALAEKKQKARL